MKSTVTLIISSCLLWGGTSINVATDYIDRDYIVESLKTIHGEN